MTIGEFIGTWLKKHPDWTQARLADKAHIKRQIINNWIKKDQIPTEANLGAVLKIMRVPQKERARLLVQCRKGNDSISAKRRHFGVQQKLNFGMKKMSQAYSVFFRYADVHYDEPQAEDFLTLETALQALKGRRALWGSITMILEPKSKLFPAFHWFISRTNQHGRAARIGLYPPPTFYTERKGIVEEGDETDEITKIVGQLKGLSRVSLYEFAFQAASAENAKWSSRIEHEKIFPVHFELGEHIGSLLDKSVLHLSGRKTLNDEKRKELIGKMKQAKKDLYTSAFSAQAKATLAGWLMQHFEDQRSFYPLKP